MAIVSATKSPRDEREEAAQEQSDVDPYASMSGSLTLVLVQDADAWRIAASHSSLRHVFT